MNSETAREVPSGPFAIIGAGRVGTAIGLLLQKAGYEIAAASVRDPRSVPRAARDLGCPVFTDVVQAASTAGSLLIAVPDREVERVCAELVAGDAAADRYIVHTAGALGITPLLGAEQAGASVLAIHPLQSIPTARIGVDRIPGSWFGVTCRDAHRGWAEKFVSDLGGRSLMIPEELRGAYHAVAVISSNFLVTLAGLSESIMGDAAPYLPLMKGTLDNLEDAGPARSLTGPIARGDEATVQMNLASLANIDGLAADSYRCMSMATVELAARWGTLENAAVRGIKRALA